jgi:hypothetical protein
VRSKPRFVLTGPLEVSSLGNDKGQARRISSSVVKFLHLPAGRVALQGWLGDSLRYCRNSATL